MLRQYLEYKGNTIEFIVPYNNYMTLINHYLIFFLVYISFVLCYNFKKKKKKKKKVEHLS